MDGSSPTSSLAYPVRHVLGLAAYSSAAFHISAAWGPAISRVSQSNRIRRSCAISINGGLEANMFEDLPQQLGLLVSIRKAAFGVFTLGAGIKVSENLHPFKRILRAPDAVEEFDIAVEPASHIDLHQAKPDLFIRHFIERDISQNPDNPLSHTASSEA